MADQDLALLADLKGQIILHAHTLYLHLLDPQPNSTRSLIVQLRRIRLDAPNAGQYVAMVISNQTVPVVRTQVLVEGRPSATTRQAIEALFNAMCETMDIVFARAGMNLSEGAENVYRLPLSDGTFWVGPPRVPNGVYDAAGNQL